MERIVILTQECVDGDWKSGGNISCLSGTTRTFVTSGFEPEQATMIFAFLTSALHLVASAMCWRRV